MQVYRIPAHDRALPAFWAVLAVGGGSIQKPLVGISEQLRLELGAVGDASPRAETTRGPAVERHGGVLIVDDDSDMRWYLRRCLAGADPPFEAILEAADGAAALRVLETSAVELIITDVVMPRLDGLSLFAHLNADVRFTEVAVLFVSGAVQESAARTRLAPGMQIGFLSKPFSARTLLEAVAS